MEGARDRKVLRSSRFSFSRMLANFRRANGLWLIRFLTLIVATGLIGCGKRHGGIPDQDITRFVAAKRTQTHELAQAQTNSIPGTVWQFFDAVERADWQKATNLYKRLEFQSGRNYQPPTASSRISSAFEQVAQKLGITPSPAPGLQELWSPISEAYCAFEALHTWDRKWMRRFSRDIIDSIPAKSIYFGGTDPGRFLISAFSESHREGRPFFTVTQNQLADGTYLDYLRTMYGHTLYIPSLSDSQQVFQDYLAGAQERLKENKLKAGEDVKVVDNRVQVSGQVAVMTINGLLARILVDKNPGREIYVEESFPLEWMYPHLSPHGLIMKLHREPLAELSEAVVNQDRDYWKQYAGELIGDWLNEETSVAQVCDFGEKVYWRKELAGFEGDAGFAGNEESQKAFSKLRASIGGIYAWRAEHAAIETEKRRMTREADFAFRQALALCPYSPEAVFRYVNLLLTQNRKAEALVVARNFLQMSSDKASAKALVENLEKPD